MDFNKDEILQNYSYAGEVKAGFPIERLLSNISIRTEYFIDEIDEVICGIIKSNGGAIDFNTIGDILGFSVYDDPIQKKYKDQAEVDVLNQLIQKRADYHLLKIAKELNPVITLTDAGANSMSTKIKYQYANSLFTGFTVKKFGGLTSRQIIKSFDLAPSIGKVNHVGLDTIIPECFLDKDLFDTIQSLCIDLPTYNNARLLSFKEPHSYTNSSQEVTYKLYTNFSNQSEIILVYKAGVLLQDISAILNEIQNQEQKEVIIRDIKFEAIWQNPDTLYTAELLRLFIDKWNWLLLLDKHIDWKDEMVWEIFAAFGNVHVWNKISSVAPVEEIIVQLYKRADKWNWSTLSGRFPDDLILSNITQSLCTWDFEVLSLKPVLFLRAAMAKIQEYNIKDKDHAIIPFWNFYDFTETLDDEFIIEAIVANAAVNFIQISARPYSFVSGILDIPSVEYRNWDFDYFSKNWNIEELLSEETSIGKYINWSIVLKRIATDEFLINQFLKNGRFDSIVKNYGTNIKSISEELLIWDEWLLDYFETHSLIRWQSTPTQPGFEINEHFPWNENLLEKYISKFSSVAGKSFLSTKVQSKDFIRRNISFGFDWVALFDNLDKNETLRKEFSADFIYELREILPWKELSSKIKSDSFILNNVQRFKDYFDFEIISGRNSKLVQQLLEIPELLYETWNWKVVTQTVYEEFILNHLHDYSWDFSVLSMKNIAFLEKAIAANSTLTLLWDWPQIAQKISPGFIIKLLPLLNDRYGILQPKKIQQFWFNVTKALTKDYLTAKASEFLFQWDWTYITKELFTKDEILTSLNNDNKRGYWDWIYLLNERINPNELEEELLFRNIQNAKSFILNTDKKKEVTSLLTNKIVTNAELLIKWMKIQKSDISGIIQLDWDILSTHKQFLYTDAFITEFAMYWNWNFLSAHKNIFSLIDANGVPQNHLKTAVKRKLNNRYFEWDWKILSQNENLIGNFSILSAPEFIRKWDWLFISLHGKFVDIRKPFSAVEHIYNRLQNFIDWKVFSTRKDIYFTKELLQAFEHRDWDWQALSESYHLYIDNELILELQSKNWNWKALSRNRSVDISLPKNHEEAEKRPGILITLKDKDWDWAYLSERQDLGISYQLLELTIDKPWNFNLLTTHFLKDQLLLENYLRLLKNNELNWDVLSACTTIKFSFDFIKEFESFWNWDALSNNKAIKMSREFVISFNSWNFDVLARRKEIIDNPGWIFEQSDKDWDWAYISSSQNYLIDSEFVERFSDNLDFTLLSANPSIKFTASLLIRFYKKWDYNSLQNNYSITRDDELLDCLKDIIDRNAPIKFIQAIDSQISRWKGYIYHFTHLTNAATVINSKKILSRNKALAKGFANAAGSVIENRHDAHDFARFYFRPQTPTQFYNENLGMDSKSGYLKQWSYFDGDDWVRNSLWKSYYPQAQRLGLPRCPIPIFFRFKLSEVLDKLEPSCNISNGNLQTGWAKYGSISSMISTFNFEDLYSTMNNTVNETWQDYTKYSQQEFLVKDEFDFSDMDNVDIIVPDESSKNALLNLIGHDNYLHKNILIDDFEHSIFHKGNRKVHVSYEDEILEVRTDYKDKHFLLIEFDGSVSLNSVDGNLTTVNSKFIKGESHISAGISNNVSFKVKFIDELAREWIIFDQQKPTR